MNLNYSVEDFKYYIVKNKLKFLGIFVFVIFGVIVGIIISLSTDSYLSLLKSQDNVLIDYVKGDVNFFIQSFVQIKNIVLMQLLMFFLTIYYPLSFLCYILITYQTVVFYLSISSILLSYGFSGFLMSLFILFPINIINLIFYSFVIVLFVNRSKQSFLYKNFWYGFNGEFWQKYLLLFAFNILVVFAVNFILVVLLKSNIFILF